MKKVILSGIMAAAFLVSTAAMAQDVKKPAAPVKAKTEVKSGVEKKEVKDAKKEVKDAKKEVKEAKKEVKEAKKEVKEAKKEKAAPVKEAKKEIKAAKSK